MGLDDFKGQNKDELSISKLLVQFYKRAAIEWPGLYRNAVQNFLVSSDEEIREAFATILHDINTDGEFIQWV